MRRLLLLLALLLLTLVVGQKLDAAPRPQSLKGHSLDIGWNDDWDKKPKRVGRTSRRDGRLGRDFPRLRDDELLFRLRDRDYDAVYLSGDFNEWGESAMTLDESSRRWELSIPVERGSLRYVYVIESDDGSLRRTDPANPERARHDGRWVSEIVVGKDHRVLRPRDNYDDDYDYDFDLVDELFVDFQRVDGFALGLEPGYRSSAPWSPDLRAHLSYGFSSERWSGRFELLQPLTPDGMLGLTLGLHDFTDYTDQTQVADFENMLTSWIFREDHRDYFRREGLAFGLRLRPHADLEFRAELRSDDHSALPVATTAGWNVGRDRFLPNPAADEGTMRSLWARAQLGDELHHVRVEFEHSADEFLSSDFAFTRLAGQLRTRLRLGYWNHLDLRIAAGSELDGELPLQKRFHVGGIGTVRGYRYQSLLTPDPDRPLLAAAPFGGAKSLVFNAEYALGVDHDLAVVLLFDAGRAWEARDADVELGDLSTSAGIGLVLGDNDDDFGLRFDVVRPLEGGSEDIMVQARLARPF